MRAKVLIAVAAAFGLLLLPLSSASEGGSRSSGRYQTDRQATGRGRADVRKLRKPPDPEAVGLLIHLLDRYASEVHDKTELDKRVEQRLAQNRVTRESARRMLANFRKISLAERRAVLGQWADIPARERIAESRYRAAFGRAAQAAGRAGHRVTTDSHAVRPSTRQTPKQLRPGRKAQPRGWLKPLDTPQATPASFRQPPESRDSHMAWVRHLSHSPVLVYQEQYPRYLLWYEGLWCHQETYVDNTDDTDQIYILTTVTDEEGNITTKLHPRPYDEETYEGLNAGDHRTGPRSRVSGNGLGRRGRPISGLPAQDLTLTVAVFEHDTGELFWVEDILAGVTATLLAGCGTLGGNPAVCAAAGVGALVTFTYHLLTGGSDDLISLETVAIAGNEVQTMENEEPRVKLGEIPYHFSTIHSGGDFDLFDPLDGPAGADYHVYFTVRLVPPPPVGQPGS